MDGVHECVCTLWSFNSSAIVIGIERWSDTYRLPGLISSQDAETEACILPPKENVLLLAIWH